MDVQRDYKARPPREPLTSLSAYVRDFQWRFPVDRRDMVVEYCREAPDFELAVHRAIDSRTVSGRMHNHQSRVKEWDRIQFGQLIQAYADEGGWRQALGAPKYLPPSPRAFDRLHDRLDHLKPRGIGPVTVYDVAVRVGAYLGVEPQSLYLHAGVRQGWVSLSMALDPGQSLSDAVYWARGVRYVSKHHWPKPLQALTADEAEDFLCTYRSEFQRHAGNGRGLAEE